MKQIRRGVFETNSSSTHSLTILTKKEFDDYKNDKLVFDRWANNLIDVDKKELGCDSEYWDWSSFGGCFETFEREFTTPSGDKMVAIGFYGYDG